MANEMETPEETEKQEQTDTTEKKEETKKEENKKAFDAVIRHKDDIEKALGVQLLWSRGDDIKASKISYQINEVSIENETDWLQMAKFHAEWSKKFYDVIVPYLR